MTTRWIETGKKGYDMTCINALGEVHTVEVKDPLEEKGSIVFPKIKHASKKLNDSWMIKK